MPHFLSAFLFLFFFSSFSVHVHTIAKTVGLRLITIGILATKWLILILHHWQVSNFFLLLFSKVCNVWNMNFNKKQLTKCSRIIMKTVLKKKNSIKPLPEIKACFLSHFHQAEIKACFLSHFHQAYVSLNFISFWMVIAH